MFGCLLAGSTGLLTFALFAGTACTFEIARAARQVEYKPVTGLLLLSTIVLLVLAWRFADAPTTFFTMAVAVLWFATAASGAILLAVQPARAVLARLTFTGHFLLYLAVPLAHLILLHATAAVYSPLAAGTNTAFKTLALIFVTVWASDVFAYLFGSRFGRRKLLPHISPKKSWFGLVAGWVGALAVALGGTWGLGGNWRAGLVLGLIVAIFAPLGDLVASLLKRSLGIKDFGHFIPGHGGLLDRLDTLLFVLPAVYWVLFNPLA